MSSRTGIHEIRDAGTAEYPAVADLLFESVNADPLTTWLYPDPVQRYAKTRHGFLFTAQYLAKPCGAVQVAIGSQDSPVAAAIWLRIPLALPAWQLRVLEFRRDRQLGKPTAIEETVNALTFGAAPQRPHWHLMAFGVAAESRGQGHGRALLEFGIACADAEHLPTHLETTEPENVGFYRSSGYEMAAEVDLPDGGPRSHVMCRDVTTRR